MGTLTSHRDFSATHGSEGGPTIASKRPRLTVRADCPRCGIVLLHADQISFAHANDHVLGVFINCDRCHEVFPKALDAPTLSMLHAFGVSRQLRIDALGVRPLTDAMTDPDVAVVSLRILLDSPEFQIRFAPNAPAESGRSAR